MKNKILFLLPAFTLTAVTLFWYFYKDGRWYRYNDELLYTPLKILHFLMPLFYLVALIVSIVRQIRSGSNAFYIVASVLLVMACSVGLFVFLMFTSGL